MRGLPVADAEAGSALLSTFYGAMGRSSVRRLGGVAPPPAVRRGDDHRRGLRRGPAHRGWGAGAKPAALRGLRLPPAPALSVGPVGALPSDGRPVPAGRPCADLAAFGDVLCAAPLPAPAPRRGRFVAALLV